MSIYDVERFVLNIYLLLFKAFALAFHMHSSSGSYELTIDCELCAAQTWSGLTQQQHESEL